MNICRLAEADRRRQVRFPAVFRAVDEILKAGGPELQTQGSRGNPHSRIKREKRDWPMTGLTADNVNIDVKHFHLFCGLGGGARGFNNGHAQIGSLEAKFRCLGGIDPRRGYPRFR